MYEASIPSILSSIMIRFPALPNAYAVSEEISWPHKYYRKDIGQKGLSYL